MKQMKAPARSMPLGATKIKPEKRVMTSSLPLLYHIPPSKEEVPSLDNGVLLEEAVATVNERER